MPNQKYHSFVQFNWLITCRCHVRNVTTCPGRSATWSPRSSPPLRPSRSAVTSTRMFADPSPGKVFLYFNIFLLICSISVASFFGTISSLPYKILFRFVKLCIYLYWFYFCRLLFWMMRCLNNFRLAVRKSSHIENSCTIYLFMYIRGPKVWMQF